MAGKCSLNLNNRKGTLLGHKSTREGGAGKICPPQHRQRYCRESSRARYIYCYKCVLCTLFYFKTPVFIILVSFTTMKKTIYRIHFKGIIETLLFKKHTAKLERFILNRHKTEEIMSENRSKPFLPS